MKSQWGGVGGEQGLVNLTGVFSKKGRGSGLQREDNVKIQGEDGIYKPRRDASEYADSVTSDFRLQNCEKNKFLKLPSLWNLITAD